MTNLKGSEADFIKNTCIELFSSKNIFYNCGTDLISKYKQLYLNKCVSIIISDEELIKTVKLFFNYNLNISLTSKAGFMHRNTLIYRLDKIKKTVGLDVKNFNEAVVFENLLLFYELIKNELY